MPNTEEKQSLAPVIILSHPQMGENIGGAARAMLNFGLTELRLVAPRDGWPNQKAIDMSAGALQKMPEVAVFASLAEALADLNFVLATTARSRDMVKPVFEPQTALAEIGARSASGQKTGILFGRERTGLENDEIAACQGIVTIPTNPDFWSLNLAQSVLLMGYEWLKLGNDMPARHFDHGDSFPVPQEKLEEFLTRLEGELETGGFFKSPDLRPTMQRNIRNMFTRPDLSDQEVKTLHGIISALIGKNKP